ncbi:MAG: helix-turn-helix domain-containing protein [Selenomonadaceae bacterium]|nr:helix-turn-helix domain-containing protein [Selenomonadaceae bacterium]
MSNDKSGEPERWFSLEEIAQHMGVSRDTVRSWIRKNSIPHHRIGRQYKFKISEVDAWVESGQSANADKGH